MLKALAGNRATAITNSQALTGLGGVGKTQLAVEYAYVACESKTFALVWFVRAEEESLLVADLAELGEQMGLATRATERPEAARDALRFLKSLAEPWLLVYDNAVSPATVRPWRAEGANGRVLLTTRARGGWAGVAAELSVDVFDLETATRFLLEKTGRDDEDGARAVANRLGGHALALSQAAAFVSQTGRSFGEYLAGLDADGRLLEQPAGEADYELAVTIVVAQSRAAAEERASSARAVLEVISYLDPERIPLTLLE